MLSSIIAELQQKLIDEVVCVAFLYHAVIVARGFLEALQQRLDILFDQFILFYREVGLKGLSGGSARQADATFKIWYADR